MLKNRIIRFISLVCAMAATLSCLTFGNAEEQSDAGKRDSMFAYTLNDYIFTYGYYSTPNAGDSVIYDETGEYPRGVIYSEVVNFTSGKEPYLVIFLSDSDYTVASCHIWKYDEQTEKTERIAILDTNYLKLSDGQVGTFSMGFSAGKRYIVYRVFQDDVLVHSDFYTAVSGDAFKYVKEPVISNEIGVVDFSNRYFHANVDVSNNNRALSQVFDNLRRNVAQSVEYENIAGRLSTEDKNSLEGYLSTLTGLNNFDIADCQTPEEYKKIVDARQPGDPFHLINDVYSLKDEIYYVRFSTEHSSNNYAILLRTDDLDTGYQVLKVRTDCIPLSGIELERLKTDYDRNTLLYNKTKNKLKLSKPGEAPCDTPEAEATKKPVIEVDKMLSREARLPVICIGGGIAIALLTILWVYLFNEGD